MITAVLLAAALAVPGEAELKAKTPEIFAKSAEHYRTLSATPDASSPRSPWSRTARCARFVEGAVYSDGSFTICNYNDKPVTVNGRMVLGVSSVLVEGAK